MPLHMILHTGKKIECPLCGKLFQHKGVLNKHIRTIHDDKKTSKKDKKKRIPKKPIMQTVETKEEIPMIHQQPMQTIQVFANHPQAKLSHSETNCAGAVRRRGGPANCQGQFTPEPGTWRDHSCGAGDRSMQEQEELVEQEVTSPSSPGWLPSGCADAKPHGGWSPPVPHTPAAKVIVSYPHCNKLGMQFSVVFCLFCFKGLGNSHNQGSDCLIHLKKGRTIDPWRVVQIGPKIV